MKMPDVVDLLNHVLDDDRLTVTYAEAEEWADMLGFSIPTPVIRACKRLGFDIGPRPAPVRRVRTISSCDHDRFFGPGSMNTAGGAAFTSAGGHLLVD